MNKEFFARKKDIDELQINKANASDVYTKEEVINKITEKVSEIAADAPEDFDTLKEMSDWINKHEGSAAAMNTAIQSKVDKEEGKSLISDLEIARLADVENYDDTKVKNDIAINRTTLGTQCKNMLKLSHPFGYKYTNADGTATWTFNNDYSVSMVVNSQISSGVAIPISEVTLKKGSYVYSVEGYSTPNITHTQLYSLNADGSWTWLANLSAIENKITVTEETTYSFRAYRNSLVTVGVTETLYPMLRYADITDSTFEPYTDDVDTRLIKNKSDIAVNKTTLGYQCKNLFDWKNAVAARTNKITYNKTESDILVTSTGPWSIVAYKLPTLKVGANYVFSTVISNFSAVSDAIIYIMISTSTSSSNIVRNAKINGNGNYKIEFTATSDTMYVLFIPNSSNTSYTNSFTASDIMLRSADITDSTFEPYKESVDERLIKNKSDIAVNKTTLGYQGKNLLKLTLTTRTVSGITFTVNDDYSITLNGTATAIIWQQIGATGGNNFRKEKLIFTGNPAGTGSGAGLEAWYMNSTTGNKYVSIANGDIFTESDYDPSGAIVYEFHINKGKTYNNVTFYPMLRYADITDDTYEPYQPSVQEQTPYSLSISGKSTSAAISYSGVPTLVCLTPNTADSTTGGLYMINSAGAVVKLIAETGVVVATNTANNTFTITNNTTTVMDVCISRCWGR